MTPRLPERNADDHFMLEQKAPPPAEAFHRTGCMAAFESFQQFEQHADEMLDLLEDLASPAAVSAKDLSAMESGSEGRLSTSINVSSSLGTAGGEDAAAVPTEPIHIVSVAVRDAGDTDDSTMSERFGRFCRSHKEELERRCVRRITFAALTRRRFPKFFTYRHRDSFKEDRIYRHLEPACAFQLELNRMRTYDLEALPTSNQKMHLYLGKAKVRNNLYIGDFLVLLGNDCL